MRIRGRSVEPVARARRAWAAGLCAAMLIGMPIALGPSAARAGQVAMVDGDSDKPTATDSLRAARAKAAAKASAKPAAKQIVPPTKGAAARAQTSAPGGAAKPAAAKPGTRMVTATPARKAPSGVAHTTRTTAPTVAKVAPTTKTPMGTAAKATAPASVASRTARAATGAPAPKTASGVPPRTASVAPGPQRTPAVAGAVTPRTARGATPTRASAQPSVRQAPTVAGKAVTSGKVATASAVAGAAARPKGSAVTPPSSGSKPPAGRVQAQVAALEDHVTYQYNALGRRDPFQTLMEGEYIGTDVGGAAPDLGGLKVVGIVWGSHDQFAMAEDVRGNSYVLRRGDRVMNGFVEALKRDAMVVNITADGQSQTVTIPVTRKGERSNASR